MNKAVFPPVPAWRPTIVQPLEEVIGRYRYYADGAMDFVFFEHGTCAVFRPGFSDAELHTRALAALHEVFHAHPDMTPREMDDGNMVVAYRGGTLSNVVLVNIARSHWPEIDARHLDALATSEVLITPMGPNKFDDRGKLALFGRCFMFMDAQSPQVVRLVRAEVT